MTPCAHCGGSLAGRRRDSIYCCGFCRNAAYEQRRASAFPQRVALTPSDGFDAPGVGNPCLGGSAPEIDSYAERVWVAGHWRRKPRGEPQP